MNDKKVSIIVPVYKAENYLNRCVDSLIHQTYKKTEIILVNDGSPDKSPAMCDDYAGKDKRIKVLHKENGGLVSAWQAGVKVSTGEYLCFVDSDDWVERDMLEAMTAYLSVVSGVEQYGEIVCCNFVINRPDRETKHCHALPPGVYEGGKLQGEIKDRLLGYENRRISMSRCMKLFSRGLIENNMQYCSPSVTMGEDVNITLPALLDCKRVVIMEDAYYYHYFYNETSMVHKYDPDMYEGIQTLYKTVKDIYRIKGRANGDVQAQKEYLYLLLLVLKNEIRSGTEGYAERIRQICREQKIAVISSQRADVRDKTNRMLYLLLKHPSTAAIGIVRLIFSIYDRNGRGK